jgi:hypothetical protein
MATAQYLAGFLFPSLVVCEDNSLAPGLLGGRVLEVVRWMEWKFCECCGYGCDCGCYDVCPRRRMHEERRATQHGS